MKLINCVVNTNSNERWNLDDLNSDNIEKNTEKMTESENWLDEQSKNLKDLNSDHEQSLFSEVWTESVPGSVMTTMEFHGEACEIQKTFLSKSTSLKDSSISCKTM